MAQFLGDIAALFEILLIAGGLWLLWRAKGVEGAGLLRASATVLLVGGIGGLACTGYYWVRYYSLGEFDHATPMMSMDGMMGGPTSGMGGRDGMGGMGMPGQDGMGGQTGERRAEGTPPTGSF